MASTPEAARALIARVADILEAAGLRGALIGGQAVNAWVELRITFDIDIEVVPDGASVRDVVDRFREQGFRVLIKQDPGERSGPDFVRLSDIETSVELDMQVAKTEFESGVIERAVLTSGQRIPVATPEDLIVLKLLASRGKDMKDLYDLGALPEIDWAYVEHWCGVWEITERLEQLRRSLAEDAARLGELFS